MFNKCVSLRDAFKTIKLQDPDLKHTKGMCVIHHTGDCHYNLVIVKFPSKELPNGQVYVIDHMNNGVESCVSSTFWFAKICGMHYRYYFGETESIYDGVLDMKFEVGKGNDLCPIDQGGTKFSRFDCRFRKESDGKPPYYQKDGTMCAVWVVLEIDRYIQNPSHFKKDGMFYESKDNSDQDVNAVRYYLGIFANKFIQTYLVHKQELLRKLSARESKPNQLPEMLSFGCLVDQLPCYGGFYRCAEGIRCQRCTTVFPDKQVFPKLVQEKDIDSTNEKGLFSKTVIRKGDYIGRYRGNKEKIKKGKTYNSRRYVVMDASNMIDASQTKSMAKHIRHSCNPNCQFRKIKIKGSATEDLWIVALYKIEAKQELTVHYDEYGHLGTEWEQILFGEKGCCCQECQLHRKAPSVEIDLNIFEDFPGNVNTANKETNSMSKYKLLQSNIEFILNSKSYLLLLYIWLTKV